MNDALPLAGRVIVIVGGTTGLGLSGAKACAAAGARLVVVGRDSDRADEAKQALGGDVSIVLGDATDASTAQSAVAEAVRRFGRIDGLYHVAGGSGRKRGDGPLDQITDEGWEFTLRLNLTSVFNSNRAAIRQFIGQQNGGAILNMGSVLGFSPAPRYFSTHAYAAAKAAIIGMSQASAAYYAPRNIRVNVVAPALVETPMSQRAAADEQIMRYVATKQPLDGGRIGRPDDLDGAVVFLLSEASRFVTGQVLAVDGGWSVSDGQTA